MRSDADPAAGAVAVGALRKRVVGHGRDHRGLQFAGAPGLAIDLRQDGFDTIAALIAPPKKEVA